MRTLTVLFTLLALRYLAVLLGELRTVRFLRDRRVHGVDRKEPAVYVVIPVLREQHTIEGAVAHFTSLPYPALELVVVTTAREGDGVGTTAEVARQLASQYHFAWLHYPEKEGAKADQINFAVDWIAARVGNRMEQTFVAIYDADSRPHESTLKYFAQSLRLQPNIRAFQQSALFVFRGESGGGWFNRFLLRGSAVRATRFVLAFEIPRLLNKLAFYNRSSLLRRLVGMWTYAHCVGHGLFVRLDLVHTVRFPPRAILEDMFYGFILNDLREPVVPLPVLDVAEVPTSISQLFYQMARWFWGPGLTVSYYWYVRERYTQKNSPKLIRVLPAVAGVMYAMSWLGTSAVFVGTLIALLIATAAVWDVSTNILLPWVTLSSVILFVVACTATVAVAAVQYDRLLCTMTMRMDSHRLGRRLLDILACLAVMFFHSFPAAYALWDAWRGSSSVAHRKTERGA